MWIDSTRFRIKNKFMVLCEILFSVEPAVNVATPAPCGMHQCPAAAVTNNHHKPRAVLKVMCLLSGFLKQHKFVVLRARSLPWVSLS